MMIKTESINVSEDDPWTADALKQKEVQETETEDEKDFLYDVDPELMDFLDSNTEDFLQEESIEDHEESIDDHEESIEDREEENRVLGRVSDTFGAGKYGQRLENEIAPAWSRANSFYSDIKTEVGSLTGNSIKRAELKPDQDLNSYLESMLDFDCFNTYTDREITESSLKDSFEDLEDYNVEGNGFDDHDILEPDAIREMEFLESRKIFDTLSLQDYKTVAVGYHHGIEDSVELKNGFTKDSYNTRAPVLVEIDHQSNEASVEALDPEDPELGFEYRKAERNSYLEEFIEN